ncbi:hypothetical protein PC129_g10521 [Phytophthora cactorum]|nr:hypothetical protein Pcac1_g18761 [Phytophthora cactorum]KAG2835181.1 hypothetical protein PC112_g5791 [Phytophthora cactorum]KAG2901472.1 hypothetical protein PC114_g13159 [Phytophthora cactorum]KAG2993132.1 hypothetical protein PC118_g4174 [Phytophthora cactorum]KAG3029264.1 hypothetical protein PC120_g4394 [Phytophthora cactorum]
MSMLEYIHRARHLAPRITTHPVDMATQVHVFISGMSAGYQCFYLTRKTPSTLEEAFAVALREDDTVTASQAFDVSRLRRLNWSRNRWRSTPSDSTMTSRSRSSRPVKFFRCGKPGHRAAVCRAPAPVVANVTIESDVAVAGRAKNGDNQYVKGALLAVEGVAVLWWQNLLLALPCFEHNCLPPPLAVTPD